LLFAAIPVALLFRFFGARLSGDPAAADLIDNSAWLHSCSAPSQP
jgi:hypothetical protein